MKQTLCHIPSCPNHGRYCRQHLGFTVPVKKEISQRGEKLDKLMRKTYVPQVKEMVEAGTLCAIKSEVCSGRAQGFHHPFGKASEELRLLEKVPCCNACNTAIESNDAFARQMGWKKSKFSIKAKNQNIGMSKNEPA